MAGADEAMSHSEPGQAQESCGFATIGMAQSPFGALAHFQTGVNRVDHSQEPWTPFARTEIPNSRSDDLAEMLDCIVGGRIVTRRAGERWVFIRGFRHRALRYPGGQVEGVNGIRSIFRRANRNLEISIPIMLDAHLNANSPAVRRPLLVALGIVAIAAIICIRWPVARPGYDVVEAAVSAVEAPGHAVAPKFDVPSRLPVPNFGSEGREGLNPFAGVTPPAAVASAEAPPAPSPVPPAPAPPTSYRLFGILTDPGGGSHVYLTKGEGALAISQGMQLDDGYQIESMTDEIVTMRYTGSQTRVEIPLRDSNPFR